MSSMTWTGGTVGTDGGPPSTNAYKRAVYKAAPSSFSVEVLSPQKHGNAYSYGLRITSTRSANDRFSMMSAASNASGTSSNSSGSILEYEIWRRWEDCLYFQDLLEETYSLMSREKRARLQAGKGVKKNGLYPREDREHHLQRAASFESLPPGPDPSMIAKNVHEFLPRLTKKGSLFRASHNTVETRAAEFRALIEALLRDDGEVPALIRELRQMRTVRDFFGFWRRDHDRIQKAKLAQDNASIRTRTDSMSSAVSGSPVSPRNSMFGSSSAMYFSASNLSLQLPTSFSIPSFDSTLSTKSKSRRPPQLAASHPSSSATAQPGSAASSSSTVHLPRPRAHTMQGYGEKEFKQPVASGSKPSRYQTTPAPLSSSPGHPPASAPPGATFSNSYADPIADDRLSTDEEQDSYPSDTVSNEDSVASSYMYHSQYGTGLQPTPQSAPATFRSQQAYAQDSPTKPIMRAKEPFIVSVGDDEQFEEVHEQEKQDDSRQQRIEHENIPLSSSFELDLEPAELSMGMRHRLQDLIIHEEEDEEQDATEQPQPHSAPSRPEGMRGSMGVSRGMYFSDDVFGMQDADMGTPRRNSNELSSLVERIERSRSPGARSPSARAEALRVLTSKEAMRRRSASPSPVASAQRLTPSNTSVRTSGSSTGSSGGGVHSSETHSSMTSVEAPSSNSMRPTSPSSFVLDTQMYEEREGGGGERLTFTAENSIMEPRSMMRRNHDSMLSMQSFMTDCSFDAIIPPRPTSPGNPGSANGLVRSMSTGSKMLRRRPNRLSQMSLVSQTSNSSGPRDFGPDDDEFMDSYLYQGFMSPSVTTLADMSAMPGREYQRDPRHRNGHISPSPAIPRPKEHTPSATPRPISPPLPSAGSRNSMISSESSSSVTPSIAPSSIFFGASGARGGGSGPEGTVAIKAAYTGAAHAGSVTIAFRADRSVALADVRAKLLDKFVNQQGVRGLSEDFTLSVRKSTQAQAAASIGGGGGVPQSPVTPVSPQHDLALSSQLSVISSEEEWREVLENAGAKLMLHVMSNDDNE